MRTPFQSALLKHVFSIGIVALFCLPLSQNAAFGLELDSGQIGNFSKSSIFLANSTNDAVAVVLDSSGNAFISGHTTPLNSSSPTIAAVLPGMESIKAGEIHGFGLRDIFVAKVNREGEAQWIRILGSEGDDKVNKIVYDDSSFVYICGRTAGEPNIETIGASSDRGHDFVLTKMQASTGIIEWSVTDGSLRQDEALDLIMADKVIDGDFVYVSGGVKGEWILPLEDGAASAAILIKYNTKGNVVWAIQKGIVDREVWGIAVAQSPVDGSIYVALSIVRYIGGRSRRQTTDQGLWRVSKAGETMWMKENPTYDDVRVAGIAIGNDGAVYISTGRYAHVYDNYNIYLMQFAADGSQGWISDVNSAGGPDGGFLDMPTGIIMAPDGSGELWVCGYSNGNMSGEYIPSGNSGVTSIFLKHSPRDGHVTYLFQTEQYGSYQKFDQVAGFAWAGISNSDPKVHRLVAVGTAKAGKTPESVDVLLATIGFPVAKSQAASEFESEDVSNSESEEAVSNSSGKEGNSKGLTRFAVGVGGGIAGFILMCIFIGLFVYSRKLKGAESKPFRMKPVREVDSKDATVELNEFRT